jgi:hypothetical protein
MAQSFCVDGALLRARLLCVLKKERTITSLEMAGGVAALSVQARLVQSPAAILNMDRAHLSSTVVRNRAADLAIYCKARPVRHRPHFAKTAFTLDWEHKTLRCPHDVESDTPGKAGGLMSVTASKAVVLLS